MDPLELELCIAVSYLVGPGLQSGPLEELEVILTAEPSSRHLTPFLCPGEDLLGNVYLE